MADNIINLPIQSEPLDGDWADMLSDLVTSGFDKKIASSAIRSTRARSRNNPALDLSTDVSFAKLNAGGLATVNNIVHKARKPLVAQIAVLEVMLAYALLGKPLPHEPIKGR